MVVNNENYENIPGFRVEYEDGNLYSNNENLNSSTKSILILGTASDGPVGEPVSVASIGGPKAAERLFGGLTKRIQVDTGRLHPETGEMMKESARVPQKGSLIRSMYEALEAGNEDVRLLRIDGKRAKTEIAVNDGSQGLLQVLGTAPGNNAFSRDLDIDSGARLSSSPVQSIQELREDGTLVKELISSAEINNVVLDISSNPGSEKIYFKKDVFRPGNTLKVKYQVNQRTYHEVLNTDEDGELIQDSDQMNYFASVHKNFSDDVLAGHTMNVFVNGNGIPQMYDGKWMWRPGSGDPNVTDRETSAYSQLEYEQGGISFTETYREQAELGVYPELDSSASVVADYFYFTEVGTTVENTYEVSGSDREFTLDHLPQAEDFLVYYDLDGDRIELDPITVENPEGDFSIIFPSPGEQSRAKVVVKSGKVPVGVRLMASYVTSDQTERNPILIVEGRYPGTVYGGLEDAADESTAYGVIINVRPDDSDLEEKIITFVKPESKKLTQYDYQLEYKTKDLIGIRTMDEFVNFVNSDSRNNIILLSMTEAGSAPLRGLQDTNGDIFLGQKFNINTNQYEFHIDEDKAMDDPEKYLWLGNDGFYNRSDMKSMQKLYERLGGKYEQTSNLVEEYKLVEQGIYSLIENYRVDSIVLVDAFENTPIGTTIIDENGYEMTIEDTAKNFGTQLAQHCATSTIRSWETIGFIGVEPIKQTGLLNIQEYIDELTEFDKNNHFMYNQASHDRVLNDDGDPIDIGHYLNVVFGPEVGMSNQKIGNYITNGVVVYAGLNSVLEPQNATTNKRVAINGLRYNLSAPQHNQLIGGRYVTFEQQFTRSGSPEYKAKDGVTASQPNSDYQRLSTVNITHTAVQLTRSIAQEFIGLPNSGINQSSMSTEIQAGLDRLKEAGILQDFRFSVFTSAREKVLGNAFITLELVPEFETRKIYTSVGLRQSI